MSHQPAILCANATCPPRRGQHTPACLSDSSAKCGGCLPRQAAPGLRLCDLCTRLLGEDVLVAAIRFHDLEHVLAGGVVVLGDAVATSSDHPGRINLAAVQARTLISSTVFGLAGLVARERGIRLPHRWVVDERSPGFVGPLQIRRKLDVSIPSAARFVAKHREWLAAHPQAADHATGLRECATGLPFHVAYPGGTKLFPIRLPGGRFAACPEPVADETGKVGACPGTLWAILRADATLLPHQLTCSHDADRHSWTTDRWMRLGAKLVKATAEQEQVEHRARPFATRSGGGRA